jgi:formylglycine-generating enzyme required for sulfatase activity
MVGATGATGAAGQNGTNGTNGTSTRVVVSSEPAGSNCTNGGYKLVFYVDANGNNTLDSAEQAGAQTAYACNALTAAQLAAQQLTATTASMTGAGLSDCGPSANESCATSLLVSGGTFYRGTDTANPATISDFRLDKYEVTVGRFRKFVDAWVGGWRPSAGAGKHTHLNGGAGLVNTAGGNEPGWSATWTGYVGAPSASEVAPTGAGATTKANWDTNLNCGGSFTTWTSAAGANEKRPQNCLSWYDLHAFCIWDGGFLASEAEWEYAATGGSEERTYPWGSATPTESYASYYVDSTQQCRGDGVNGCTINDLIFVGTKATGNGRWGQSDLAGNVWEWNLDWNQSPYVATCNNCTNITASSLRVFRGGSFNDLASFLPAASRGNGSPAYRSGTLGGRCARTP